MAKLSEAQKIAENLLGEMDSFIERGMIAGSIRRGKSEVKDIEIVVIPKFASIIPQNLKTPATVIKAVKLAANGLSPTLPSNWELFGTADDEDGGIPKENGKFQNLLYLWANRQNRVRWIKPGTNEIVAWNIKPDGKYWRGIVQNGNEKIKLDLFLANPNNWGVISTIRTGPWQFSQALVAFIKNQTPYRVQDGHLTLEATGEIIPCHEEIEFFQKAWISFVPVEEREQANPYSILCAAN